MSAPASENSGSHDSPGDTAVCSAKGCREPAVWVLAWNNPKLHTPERRKTWLACEEHREHLSRFLGARDFLKDVVALDVWEGRGDGGGRGGSAADR
ncbi:hypothetical protein CUT44_06470 [Streptomyces carminius]|uniref:Acetone carboxylase n=1 Tax=Streptomyces carminius TaxID=2665496 RepID=A0A2M8M300_9ACTN|nr:hypothetical protein [Streptomyces carminius]PJE98581.1 hypothetical protein CUT44_06470 [Streptomyces carminius]